MDLEAALTATRHHQEEERRARAQSNEMLLRMASIVAGFGVVGSLIGEHYVPLFACVLIGLLVIGVCFEDRRRELDAIGRDMREEDAVEAAATAKREKDGPSAEERATALLAEFGAEAPRVALERSEAAWDARDFGHAVRWNSAAKIAEERLAERARR
jgi:hypothetical protein